MQNMKEEFDSRLSRKERNKKKKIKTIILLIISLIILVGAVASVYMMFFKKQDETTVVQLGEEVLDDIEEVKTPKTGAGEERAIAVMIDNHKEALPHAGLDKAMIVYEIIVEGGESRLMAIFKGQDIEKIGPVRSARHYFLDYAFENDAIYVHYGWSPRAKLDISNTGINHINGISEDESFFRRAKDKYAPHNVVTSTKDILEIAKKYNFRTNSDSSLLLNYQVEDVKLENAIVADKIQIPYSESNIVKYTYDNNEKKYIRYSKGVEETDWDSKESVKVKNILIEFIKSKPLDDPENKDRQDLNNIGTFDGYYITNGQAIKINATKETRKGKTVYKDLDGNEISVNDGNTFIQICPIDSNVKISADENE